MRVNISHTITPSQMSEKIVQVTSLFVYITEFVVIYTSPSWVHLFKQREKGKGGEGERKTARKEEQYKNSCANN